MKIYLAGGITHPETSGYIEPFIENRLLTFFEKPKLDAVLCRNAGYSLFLDSGAYSGFSQGKPVDIGLFMDYISENEKYIDVYANLDDIQCSKTTWRNQRIMEQNGLSPIPVFHKNEDIRYLDKCVREYPYFALGGIAKGTRKSRINFFNTCFNRIEKLNPPVFPKIHGFGMTDISLMLSYPWYSVDSTSWLMSSSMGSILVPCFKQGVPFYGSKAIQLHTSDISKKQNSLYFTHLQKYLDSIDVPIGLGGEYGVITHYTPRRIANIHFFKKLQEYTETNQFHVKLMKTLL